MNFFVLIVRRNLHFSVYLRTTPEVVYERIKKRARFEESNVPLKYLKDLHEAHENWLVRRKYGLNIPVNYKQL